MKITAIEIQNLRSFKNIPKLSFSECINVFIGPNNSGKSTILRTILNIQYPELSKPDLTIGQAFGYFKLFFSGEHPPEIVGNAEIDSLVYNLERGTRQYGLRNGQFSNWGKSTQQQEPNNLIYPYLSKRKTGRYDSSITEQNVNQVSGNFVNLYAKIDRLVTPQFQPANKEYIEACNHILGFEVSSLAKGDGKQAVYFVNNMEHIPLTSMGEGVANIIGLISDLCVANERIFIIEEPENDIHPKALKELLELIVKKSNTNQFFISTHSNIVMKYLGAAVNSKLFHINSTKGESIDRPNLFTSTIKEVSDSFERKQVLEGLGYDMFDFDMWSCWLFLEESSAELLIRKYFVPWFANKLSNKMRTFATNGLSEMAPKFDDFNRLFVFLHLEPTYKNKVWVVVDGGKEENEIILKMQETYSKSGWSKENFFQFSNHDFEMYYPQIFSDRVDSVLATADKQSRRNAKKKLLDEVIEWIELDPSLAKKEFENSASEVILALESIEKQVNTF